MSHFWSAPTTCTRQSCPFLVSRDPGLPISFFSKSFHCHFLRHHTSKLHRHHDPFPHHASCNILPPSQKSPPLCIAHCTRLWTRRGASPQQRSYTSVVSLPLRFVTLAVVATKPCHTLVVNHRATLSVKTVAPFQALAAAADTAVLLHTCVALLVDVLAVVLVLPHRTVTIIFSQCNVATVFSPRFVRRSIMNFSHVTCSLFWLATSFVVSM